MYLWSLSLLQATNKLCGIREVPSPLLFDSFIIFLLCYKDVCLVLNQSWPLASEGLLCSKKTNKKKPIIIIHYYIYVFFFCFCVVNKVCESFNYRLIWGVITFPELFCWPQIFSYTNTQGAFGVRSVVHLFLVCSFSRLCKEHTYLNTLRSASTLLLINPHQRCCLPLHK